MPICGSFPDILLPSQALQGQLRAGQCLPRMAAKPGVGGCQINSGSDGEGHWESPQGKLYVSSWNKVSTDTMLSSLVRLDPHFITPWHNGDRLVLSMRVWSVGCLATRSLDWTWFRMAPPSGASIQPPFRLADACHLCCLEQRSL